MLKKFLETVKGKARLGIQAYADGLMIIPKTLATNAGYDSQEVMVKLLEEARDGASVGMDCDTGEPCIPKDKGIYDNYRWAVFNLVSSREANYDLLQGEASNGELVHSDRLQLTAG